jgi:hypothetical protein
MMSADCCMPWRLEWCTMEAVGQRRLPWFIGDGLCVLPSFNLGKVCSDVADPKSNQQPTTYPPNYLHEKMVDEDVSSCYPLLMLVRKPPVPWCNFPHHLGAGRARQSSGCHGWVVCVVISVYWNQGRNVYIIQVSTVWRWKYQNYRCQR